MEHCPIFCAAVLDFTVGSFFCSNTAFFHILTTQQQISLRTSDLKFFINGVCAKTTTSAAAAEVVAKYIAHVHSVIARTFTFQSFNELNCEPEFLCIVAQEYVIELDSTRWLNHKTHNQNSGAKAVKRARTYRITYGIIWTSITVYGYGMDSGITIHLLKTVHLKMSLNGKMSDRFHFFSLLQTTLFESVCVCVSLFFWLLVFIYCLVSVNCRNLY